MLILSALSIFRDFPPKPFGLFAPPLPALVNFLKILIASLSSAINRCISSTFSPSPLNGGVSQDCNYLILLGILNLDSYVNQHLAILRILTLFIVGGLSVRLPGHCVKSAVNQPILNPSPGFPFAPPSNQLRLPHPPNRQGGFPDLLFRHICSFYILIEYDS